MFPAVLMFALMFILVIATATVLAVPMLFPSILAISPTLFSLSLFLSLFLLLLEDSFSFFFLLKEKTREIFFFFPFRVENTCWGSQTPRSFFFFFLSCTAPLFYHNSLTISNGIRFPMGNITFRRNRKTNCQGQIKQSFALLVLCLILLYITCGGDVLFLFVCLLRHLTVAFFSF